MRLNIAFATAGATGDTGGPYEVDLDRRRVAHPQQPGRRATDDGGTAAGCWLLVLAAGL